MPNIADCVFWDIFHLFSFSQRNFCDFLDARYSFIYFFVVSINEEKKKEETDSGALARARWRKAIMEQRILIRMEKENRNLAGMCL